MSMHSNERAKKSWKCAGRILAALLGTCLTSRAFALGLGEIEVHSHLKQRLDASIELVVTKNDDLGDIKVLLGQQRPGTGEVLASPVLLRQLTFEVRTGRGGAPYVQVGSKEPISEPAFSFPIEVLTRGTRITRIYSVLLNPSGYVPRPRRRETAETAAPRRVPALEPSAPETAVAAGGTYVVQPGDTLSAIGFRVRPDKSISGWQMALALFEANPDAFINGDVNKVKAGATLVIPSMNRIQRKTPQEARAEIIGVRPAQAAAPPVPVTPPESAAAEPAEEAQVPEQAAAEPDQPDYLFKILSPEEEQSLKLKQAEAAEPAVAPGEPEPMAATEAPSPETMTAQATEPAAAAQEEAPMAEAAGGLSEAERQKMNQEMQELTSESEQLRGQVESLRSRLQETNRQLLELAAILKRQQEGGLFRFTGDRTTLSAVAALLVVLIGLLLLLLLRQSTIYMAARSQRR